MVKWYYLELLHDELSNGIKETLVEVKVVANLLEIRGRQVGDELPRVVHYSQCALFVVVHGDEGINSSRILWDAEDPPDEEVE